MFDGNLNYNVYGNNIEISNFTEKMGKAWNFIMKSGKPVIVVAWKFPVISLSRYITTLFPVYLNYLSHTNSNNLAGFFNNALALIPVIPAQYNVHWNY